MKLRFAILIVSGFTLTLVAGIHLRPHPLYRPDFSLPVAYAEAVEKLRIGDALSHIPRDEQLYCVGAKLSTNIIPGGEWTFEFASTNGLHRQVVVWKEGKFFTTLVPTPD